MNITLAGKTRKGKNRVREHGEAWSVERLSEKVQFSNDKGPFALIRSKKTGVERWIKLTNDADFAIIAK